MLNIKDGYKKRVEAYIYCIMITRKKIILLKYLKI